MKEAKMKLKQISVPIENDHDRTYELTKALGDKGINLRALSLVDTGYYGELRILVSDVPAARHILMQKGIPAHIDEVIAVEVEDRPGQFSNLLESLRHADIKIRYAYACAGINSGRAILVCCFNDNDRAITVLKEKGVYLLDEMALSILEAA
jgi:hypothetical protein